MRLAHKLAALFHVEVDELTPQHHACNWCRTTDLNRTGRHPTLLRCRRNRRRNPEELLNGSHRDIDADWTVLESKKREIRAWIAAKVELKRD